MATDNSQYTVLVVDDVPVNILLVKGMLAKQKFNVISANSGQQALDVLTHEHPDGILLDILMPNMNGFETTRAIRANMSHNQLAITHIQLKDASKRAEAADRMKTALLQNMNADINEPLNSVAGFAQLIVEANASTTAEERAEYYKQLSSSTAKMLDIVGNVLEDIQHV